jgi:hypothetical protein
MKKIVLNISDSTYEKLRFEAMLLKKNVPSVCAERLMERPFPEEVEIAYSELMDQEINKILKEPF